MVKVVALLSLFLLPVQDDVKEHIKSFKKQLKAAKTESDIMGAVEFLGSKEDEKVLRELIALLSRYSPNVKMTVGNQIAKYKKNTKAASALLGRAGRERDPAVSAHFLNLIGAIKERAAARALPGYFEHKELDIGTAALRSTGKLKAKVSISPLIKYGVKLEKIQRNGGGAASGSLPGPSIPSSARGNKEQMDRKRAHLREVADALKQITGERYNKMGDWQQWWKKNQSKWKEPEL